MSESWRVPDMDANTGKFVPEEHGLMPKGEYTCTIVDFGDIKPSKTKEYHEYIRIELRVVDEGEFEGRKLFTYVYGPYPVIRMINWAAFAYIGLAVSVKVGIREYNDRHYNDAFINWPNRGMGMTDDV